MKSYAKPDISFETFLHPARKLQLAHFILLMLAHLQTARKQNTHKSCREKAAREHAITRQVQVQGVTMTVIQAMKEKWRLGPMLRIPCLFKFQTLEILSFRQMALVLQVYISLNMNPLGFPVKPMSKCLNPRTMSVKSPQALGPNNIHLKSRYRDDRGIRQILLMIWTGIGIKPWIPSRPRTK